MKHRLDDLALRAREGDRGALEELLERSQLDLRRMAHHLCRAQDAEDAMQDALLIVSVRINRFRGVGKFTSWMFSIIRNECARYLRHAAKWVGSDLDLQVADDADPSDSLRDRRLAKRIGVAIAELPEGARRVFVMRELEGRSTREVAAVLDLSESNVKVRLHRARAALREALHEFATP